MKITECWTMVISYPKKIPQKSSREKLSFKLISRCLAFQDLVVMSNCGTVTKHRHHWLYILSSLERGLFKLCKDVHGSPKLNIRTQTNQTATTRKPKLD